MTPKLLFIVNVDWFFLSHRLPIALEAIKHGYEVHIATEITNRLDEMRSHGLIVHPLRIRREEKQGWQNLVLIIDFLNIIKMVKPDIVHLVTIRPVIFGGIIARWMRVPGIVAAISGLGTVFSARGTILACLRRYVICSLYRLALGGANTRVIFQNEQDQSCLVNHAHLKPYQAELIRGSGVDLKLFQPANIPEGTPVVLMACRLIADKGVQVFLAAARLVKARGVVCRFWLVGDIDRGNPRCLTETDLDKIRAEGIVELPGQRDDMPEIMAQAQIVTLPSYYGEGVPKVLIEAAASGRAIITTDTPGCRDTVVPGVSGLLVPPRNASALADAIAQLVPDKAGCERMGREGRKLAEREFNVTMVVTRHIKIYEQLMKRVSP